jgi:YVTN family beta-propeller protein
MNSGSESATVIDAVNLNVVRTIFLGGKPEFAVSDDLGHVYVNLEDRNQVVQINASGLNVVKRWSVAPGRVPASLAIDARNQRLFIGCRNRKLVVMDAKSGKVITALPIGDKVDATAFDEGTHKIISSTGDGNITVVQQDDPNHYRIVQTIKTQKGSRTFGLDRRTHKLFVPAADFAAPVYTRAKLAQKQHPELLKGSFKILIFEQ